MRRSIMLVVAALAAALMVAPAALAQGVERVPNPEAVPCSEILTTVQGQPNSATNYQVQRFGAERVNECVAELAAQQGQSTTPATQQGQPEPTATAQPLPSTGGPDPIVAGVAALIVAGFGGLLAARLRQRRLS